MLFFIKKGKCESEHIFPFCNNAMYYFIISVSVFW